MFPDIILLKQASYLSILQIGMLMQKNNLYFIHKKITLLNLIQLFGILVFVVLIRNISKFAKKDGMYLNIRFN